MKRQSIILGVLISLFMWSCDGGSTSEETEEVKSEREIYSLETKEGMLKKLNEYNIDIPDKFVFVEVEYKSGAGYTAKFQIESMDESTTTETIAWYQKQCAALEEDGWRRKTIRDGDRMLGAILNKDAFYKDSGNLSISSNYDPAENKYIIYLKPFD